MRTASARGRRLASYRARPRAPGCVRAGRRARRHPRLPARRLVQRPGWSRARRRRRVRGDRRSSRARARGNRHRFAGSRPRQLPRPPPRSARASRRSAAGSPPSGLEGRQALAPRVLGSEPVCPSAPDVDEAEAPADPPRLGQAAGLHRHGGDASPGRVAGVADRRLGDRPTHNRAPPSAPTSSSPRSSLPSAAPATTPSSRSSTAVTSTPRRTSPAAPTSSACRSARCRAVVPSASPEGRGSAHGPPR